MDLEVTCPRCQKEFTDANLPRLLTACGHTFCDHCMHQLANHQHNAKIRIECPDCPEGASFVELERVALLPKNMALVHFLETRKNNTSTRSVNSAKDESFTAPKAVRSCKEGEDDALAIQNGQELQLQGEHGQRKKERLLTTPVLSSRVSDENEICLLHNKLVELVCLVDHQRLCSKCALFGQHRGHDFISLDQVEQGNKRIYETLLEIFDEKASVLDQLTSKKRREAFNALLTRKTAALKKEIADRFKKIQDELAKTERAAYHHLEEMAENVERRMKKLLVIDEKTIGTYESWAVTAEKRFDSYESGTHEGLLEFYLSGKGLIESGKEIIAQLRHQEEKSSEEASKFVEELGVNFNDAPTLSSLGRVVELYESDREQERRSTLAEKEKENSKIFANCEFSYEDIKQRVKTEAHEDDESLLELVDEFEQGHHSQISVNILNESMVKLEKATPTKMARPSVTGTPTSKPLPRKRPTVALPHKEAPQEKREERREGKEGKEEKKEVPREAVKKKMRAIKLPEKYEKMMEGVLSDSVETVDFTNAELGDAIALQICELFKANTRQRYLKLIRNKITDEGFAKMVPFLTAFSTLNFSQNVLTENCLNVLADQRPLLPNLKTVILSQNKIAERKCKAVVERLRKMDLTISI